jgi:hypothetical protein
MAARGPLPSTYKLAKRLGVDRGVIRRDLRALGLVTPTEGGPPPESGGGSAPGRERPSEGSTPPPSPTPSDGQPPPTPDPDDEPDEPSDPPSPAPGPDRPVPPGAPPDPPAAPSPGSTETPSPRPRPHRPPERLGDVVLSPEEQSIYRNLIGALDRRVQQLLAPVIQAQMRTQSQVEELSNPAEATENPLGKAITASESKISSRIITEAGTESLRIIDWDLQSGELIRIRWHTGWATRFDTPVRLAQYAIDFLSENEDRIRQLEEERDAAVGQAAALAGFVSPARRFRWMEERLLAVVLAAQLQGKPMEAEQIHTIFSLLRESAKTPLIREPSLSAITVARASPG